MMTTDERRFVWGIGLGLLVSGLMNYVGYRPTSAFVPILLVVIVVIVTLIRRRR